MRHAMTKDQILCTLKIVAAFIWSWAIFMIVAYQMIDHGGSYWWAVLALPLIIGAYLLVYPTLHKAKREELLLAMLIMWLVVSAANHVL